VKSPQITWISSEDSPDAFPDIERAFDVPNGLLAAGGDLSGERLLYAYSHGIFPWFSNGQPILWWSPDPRCVLYADRLHISRRLYRSLRQSGFDIRINSDFDAVVAGCTRSRRGQDGTWITPDMRSAYNALHDEGWAHSIEVWLDDELAGGLYGVAIDRMFFGESMFSAVSNASKAAMVALCFLLVERGVRMLDCQVASPHLMSLGAELIPRREFAAVLETDCASLKKAGGWPRECRKINAFLSPNRCDTLQ
jgi:leucyl/phenylalanyl-tRNA--protein transferase